MKNKASKREEAKSILIVTVISTLIGSIFGLIMHIRVSEELNTLQLIRSSLIGACAGFAISLSIQILEQRIRVHIKRLPLFLNLLLVPILYTAIIAIIYPPIIIFFFRYKSLDNDFYLFQTIIFSLIITFIITLTGNITTILGQKVLPRLLMGKYHKPSSEERFIMFLDLKGSTTIAEKIGDQKFHAFLNDFFIDITEPILASKAEIYKYVGDEVILTWTKSTGTKKNNTLNSYFLIKEHITDLSDKYIKKYGFTPEYKAGLHFGNVIIGEMGSYKKEIALTGDTMNTTARIEGTCGLYDKNILISESVIKECSNVEENFKLESLGEIALKGKVITLPLYSISKK